MAHAAGLRAQQLRAAQVEARTANDFCEAAFGRMVPGYKNPVIVEERFLHPSEFAQLLDDATTALEARGWEPMTTLRELTSMMANTDLATSRG